MAKGNALVDTGLGSGWHDEDELILHAVMSVLCQYVEAMGGEDDLQNFTDELRQPGSEGNGPRDTVVSQAETQSVALEIFRWWKYRRPELNAERDRLIMEVWAEKKMGSRETGNPNLKEIVLPDLDQYEKRKQQRAWDIEKEIDQTDAAMLHKLVDVRRGIWT